MLDASKNNYFIIKWFLSTFIYIDFWQFAEAWLKAEVSITSAN